MSRTLILLSIGLVLSCAAPAFSEEPAAPADAGTNIHKKLIAAKASSVVSIKMVIKLSADLRGQAFEREFNTEGTGVMVDASGLVMVSAAAFQARGMGRFFGDAKMTPNNIRVIFPGDETEYDAILGAKDTKLGLGFLLIKDLKDRDVNVVDFSRVVTPDIGQRLYGVTRLSQGFDHAPVCDTAHVIGQLTKPRKVLALSGASSFQAEPLYMPDGAVAGVVISQEGATDDAGMRTCLLPVSVAQATIKRSLKAAKDALEEALEAEKEAAEEAEEDEESDGEKKDGEGKEDGKKEDEDGKEEKGGDKKDDDKKDAPKKGDDSDG